MSTSGYPEALPASDVAFDVERFEWTAVDRLEVRGRWSGVRGRRFMRPSLNVDVARGRRRLIALLEHKPWAAGDGDTWVAAFPWDGEREGVGPAVLEVGAGLSVPLPAPREPHHVREEAAKLASAPPPAPPVVPERSAEDQRDEELWRARAAVGTARREAELAREQMAAQRSRAAEQVRDAEAARAVAERERDRLRQETSAVRARFEEELAAAREETVRLRGALEARAAEVEERERALETREADLGAREGITDERDAARRERDAAAAERDVAVRERDRALGEREALVAERERAVRERRAAVAERDAARREREAAVAARASALADRDRVQRVRQGPPRAAPGATEPAVRVLGPVRDDGPPGHETPAEEDPATAAQPPPTAAQPPPTAAQPPPTTAQPPHTAAQPPAVRLIEDEAVAGSRAGVGWDVADPDRKPLLTRAEPLDRGRGPAATWALRLVALLVLVAVLVALVLLVGGGAV
jgi:hypothetical protein